MYNGNTRLKLSRKYPFSSGEVDELSMREPFVADQLLSQETQKTSARSELQLIANLCGLAFEDTLKLAACDYRLAREALQGFIDPAESGASEPS